MTKGPLSSGAVRLGAAQEIMRFAEGRDHAVRNDADGHERWASLCGKRIQWAGDSADAFFGERASRVARQK